MAKILQRRVAGIIKHHKKIILNIINFFLFQVTNYLVPLITIPYVVQKVGAEKFGILSFIQAFIYYFFIIVDYGIEISGVRKIAKARDSGEQINLLFNTFMLLRILLMIICLIILLICMMVIPGIKSYYLIYLFSFGIIPAQILLTTWFYMGMEEVHYLNYINLVARILYVIGIFVIIREENDFYLVPAINSVSLLVAGIVSMIIIFKKFNIKIISPGIANFKSELKSNWDIFISNIFITIYRNSNVLILGLLASDMIVGFYSASEKLIRAIQSVFAPITKVMYPHLSRKKAISPANSIRSIKKLTILLGILTFIISLVLIIFAKPVVLLLFGEEFIASINVLRIGGFAIFFSVLNFIIGIIYMLNYNMKKEFTRSVIATGILNVIFCYYLSSLYYEVGAAIAFVGAEGFLCLNLLFQINRKIRKQSVVYE